MMAVAVSCALRSARSCMHQASHGTSTRRVESMTKTVVTMDSTGRPGTLLT